MDTTLIAGKPAPTTHTNFLSAHYDFTDVSGTAPLFINIQKTEWQGDYRIRLDFDDGVSQTVDFLPFLQKASHPDLRAYLQPDNFKSYRLDHGELVWGDYDLCFPIIDLYQNRLTYDSTLAQAA